MKNDSVDQAMDTLLARKVTLEKKLESVREELSNVMKEYQRVTSSIFLMEMLND